MADQGGAVSEVTEALTGVLTDVFERGEEANRGSWQAAVDAGLVALAAPAELGGEGFGMSEVGVLLHGAASRAADLPLWETVAAGLLPLVRTAPAEVREQIVPKVLAGDLMLAPALAEVGRGVSAAPETRFADGVVTGAKIRVPTFASDTLLVVRAASEAGEVAVLVDPSGAGVTRIDTDGSASRGEASYRFDGAPAVGVCGEGSGEVLLQYATAGLVMRAAGLLSGALELTAGYIREREQFGRVLAEFQAVAVQIADVFIASRMLDLIAAEVCRRLDADEPVAEDLAVASYSVADRALSALQTCHHLHGGVGVDVTYPLHNYFSQVQDIVRLLGGTSATLPAVGLAESRGKNAELTESQRDFKQQARDYFSSLLTREDRVELLTDRHGDAYHRTIKRMGADGWMGVGWPTEYGGKGLGGIEQQIFANEAARADVHLPSVTLQTVGPTLQAFGTDLQKEKFLSDILSGDVHFAIGYSEADAGTDLASLRCSAVRVTDTDGDYYLVNGHKMWTTGGHAADWIWLAVRTDPEAPKHRGISVLIVDTRDPGYSWTPIVTCDGSHHVNATYYNDVKVPVDMLVGEENRGWQLITTQLNHERVMLGPAGRLEGLRDLVRDWAADRKAADGTPLLELPAVRDTLAQVTAAFRLNELLNWRVASGVESQAAAVASASASKVFASEEVQRLGLALEEIVAVHGDPADPETAFLLRYLDLTSKRNLVLTFGGGVNEIQRELIAQFGLGLPRVPR